MVCMHMSSLSLFIVHCPYTHNIRFQMNASELTTSVDFQIKMLQQWFWVLLLSRNISASYSNIILLSTYRNYFICQILFQLVLCTIKEFHKQNKSGILRVILSYSFLIFKISFWKYTFLKILYQILKNKFIYHEKKSKR